jgi:hypothetical protein
MGVDSRLDILSTFQLRSISPGGETTLVISNFNRPEHVSVEDRGWLFVSETESSIGDIVTLDGDGASIDVPNWSMTPHVHVDAILPWLDAKWQARDLAFLLDDTKEWHRVEYRPTDAIVFAKRTLRCGRCGWTGSAGAAMSTCPKCSGRLLEQEIFCNQEAAFPIDADARFVETRAGFWNHDHCLICDRESSFADGPNSVGLWLCERCFDRYVSRQDFSFLLRRSATG